MKLSLTTVCANKECDNILQTRYKSAFQEVATDATRQDMDKALKALQSSEQTLNLLLTSPPKSWEVRTTCYSYVSTAGFRYLTFSSHLVLLQTVARELRNIFENIIVLMRTTEKEANARILFVRLSSPQCYLSSTLFVCVCVMSSELIMVTQAIGRISEKLQRILGAGNDGNFIPTPMSIPIPTQTHTHTPSLPFSFSHSHSSLTAVLTSAASGTKVQFIKFVQVLISNLDNRIELTEEEMWKDLLNDVRACHSLFLPWVALGAVLVLVPVLIPIPVLDQRTG